MEIIEVIKTINRGGFGLIEEVKCNDGNCYARKTFDPNPQYVSDPNLLEKFKKRFIREVKTQKILPQDLFIPIIYENLQDEKPWFLMPVAEKVYSEEITKSKLAKRTPEGLGDILNSLEFIHSKGLVHRDLKPQNILLHEGVWKLADFGLISHDKEILSQSITTSNNAFGTAMYCAPEQISDFKRVTFEADIYSFGAILHDIFSGETRIPYSELTGPGEVGMIIERCTKRKKELRFKGVKSLRSKLLYILAKKEPTSDKADVQWVESLKEISNWDRGKLENFVFYLKQNEDAWELIFYELNKRIIKALIELDNDFFIEFSLMYLSWVQEMGFDFDYCDVVVNYINNFYDATDDIEVKSRAVIAAAYLGRSHNRWYVMRYVLKMAGKEIDDDLAFRISLEIELDKKNRYNLIRCAEQINKTVESYHPMIAENLQPFLED